MKGCIQSLCTTAEQSQGTALCTSRHQQQHQISQPLPSAASVLAVPLALLGQAQSGGTCWQLACCTLTPWQGCQARLGSSLLHLPGTVLGQPLIVRRIQLVDQSQLQAPAVGFGPGLHPGQPVLLPVLRPQVPAAAAAGPPHHRSWCGLVTRFCEDAVKAAVQRLGLVRGWPLTWPHMTPDSVGHAQALPACHARSACALKGAAAGRLPRRACMS